MHKLIGLTVLGLASLLSVGCDKPPPSIESECVMNGFGSGHCTFTNTGKGPGSVCGHVLVKKNDGTRTAPSSVFCSGEVKPSSTAKVEFTVTEVRSLCEGEDWRTVCSFGFVKKE